MFMIQAINSLITQLETHLIEHLSALGVQSQGNVDVSLTNLFKHQPPVASGGYLSSLFAISNVSSPRNELRGLQSNHIPSALEASSSAPVTSNTNAGNGLSAQTEELAIELKEEEKLENTFFKGFHVLCDLEKIQTGIFSQVLSNSDTEQTKLRFNLTWDDLMRANVETFENYRLNELRGENVTELKMMIVAHLRYQLLSFVGMAKNELIARETLFQENDQIRFQDLVDDWLQMAVQIKVQEAKLLLSRVLENAKCKVQVPVFSFMSIEMGPQQGTSEVIVETCGLVVKNFLAFCKEANQNRTSGDLRHAATMVDVFPGEYNTKTPMMLINQSAANYVIQNLFDTCSYDAYTFCGVSHPAAMYAFNSQTAQEKRRHVLGALEAFDKMVIGKNKNDPAFWGNLFTKLHDLQATGARIESTYLISRMAKTIYTTPPSKLDEYYRDLHNGLLMTAPDTAQAEVEMHRKCHW